MHLTEITITVLHADPTLPADLDDAIAEAADVLLCDWVDALTCSWSSTDKGDI